MSTSDLSWLDGKSFVVGRGGGLLRFTIDGYPGTQTYVVASEPSGATDRTPSVLPVAALR